MPLRQLLLCWWRFCSSEVALGFADALRGCVAWFTHTHTKWLLLGFVKADTGASTTVPAQSCLLVTVEDHGQILKATPFLWYQEITLQWVHCNRQKQMGSVKLSPLSLCKTYSHNIFRKAMDACRRKVKDMGFGDTS